MRQRLIYACAQSLLVSAELVPALEPAGPSSEVAQSVNGPASNFSQAQRPTGLFGGTRGPRAGLQLVSVSEIGPRTGTGTHWSVILLDGGLECPFSQRRCLRVRRDLEHEEEGPVRSCASRAEETHVAARPLRPRPVVLAQAPEQGNSGSSG